jgi:hypothetical protein
VGQALEREKEELTLRQRQRVQPTNHLPHPLTQPAFRVAPSDQRADAPRFALRVDAGMIARAVSSAGQSYPLPHGGAAHCLGCATFIRGGRGSAAGRAATNIELIG